MTRSTASHVDSAPRVRVIIEASREMSRSEGGRVGAALQAQAQAALRGADVGFDASVARPRIATTTPLGRVPQLAGPAARFREVHWIGWGP